MVSSDLVTKQEIPGLIKLKEGKSVLSFRESEKEAFGLLRIEEGGAVVLSFREAEKEALGPLRIDGGVIVVSV